MNIEQIRAEFEAWIASPPYVKPIDINPEASGFPGQYRSYEVQLAWEGYKAGRAALQSQDREDAERWRYWKKWLESDESDGHQYPPEVDLIWHKRPDLTFDEAIDHARSAEGEA